MGDYAVQADVEGRLKGRYPSGFSASTQPTATQVTTWITDAENELKLTLTANGITPPATSTNGATYLKGRVTDYVEGRVRASNAATAGDHGNEDGAELIRGWRGFLRDLQIRASYWDDVLAESVSGGRRRVKSYVSDGSEGVTRWFTRDTDLT